MQSVALVWFAIFVSTIRADPPKHVQFHCDVVDHYAKKDYVDRVEDLLNGSDQLQLLTVGVPESEIRQAFHCRCTRQPFDPDHRQPFPPATLLATWTCGSGDHQHQIQVAEFSNPTRWGASQWEEFVARATGRALWGEPLAEAGWFDRKIGGWHFNSLSAYASVRMPFALLIRGYDPAVLSQKDSSLRNVRKYVWNEQSSPPVQDIRTAMVRMARDVSKNREYQRGREDQKREDGRAFERGRAQGRLECAHQPQLETVLNELQQQKKMGAMEQSQAWTQGYKAAYDEQPDASPNCPECPVCPPAPSCPAYEEEWL